MSQKVVHRPARTSPPARRFRPFSIEGPQPVDPAAAEAGGGNIMTILPMLAAGGSMMVMMTFRQSPFAAVGAIAMMVSVVVGVVMFISNRGKATRQRTILRDTYTRYLERTRGKLRDEEIEAQHAARAASPPPAALFDIVRDPTRLWERRRYHEDFLRCRIGSGHLPTRDIGVHLMETATAIQDEFMVREAEVLQRRFEASPDMPVTVPLDSAGNISVVGTRDFGLQVTRSLLTGAAALQSPEDLRIAVITPRQGRPDWDWLELLPHLDDTSAQHYTGAVKLIAPDAASLMELLDADLQYRSKVAGENTRFGTELTSGPPTLSRLVVVVDGYGADAQDLDFGDSHFSLQARGITVLHLCAERVQEPSESPCASPGRVRVRTAGPASCWRTGPGTRAARSAPRAGWTRWTSTPRPGSSPGWRPCGSPWTPSSTPGRRARPRGPSCRRWSCPRNWTGPTSSACGSRGPTPTSCASRSDRTTRASRCCWTSRSPPQLGMGPHGLCVGATGSGKSELLRTLVLAPGWPPTPPRTWPWSWSTTRAAPRSPPSTGLPHVAGIITNLVDDLTADRARARLPRTARSCAASRC